MTDLTSIDTESMAIGALPPAVLPTIPPSESPPMSFRPSTWMFSVLVLALALPGVPSRGRAEEKPLAELLPRIPPQAPEVAPKTFELQHGFSLELVAAEPLVADPIDAAFDEQNRMYVVEMSDYPFLPEQRVQKYKEQRPESWSRIRLLTDTNHDGQMDKSTVFADKLRWAQSVCCSKGGVYVLAPPHLYYMKDTSGDDVADVKEILCTGFSQTNVQGLANGLEWGRDNAIYFSSGLAGGELTIPAAGGKPERKFTPGRRDLRLDPATNEITMVSGGQQFGHTIDDFGERFICSNSNHIVHVTWPLHYLERNPQLTVPSTTRPIAKEGSAAVVFRKSPAEPWRLVRTARRAADPEFAKRLPPTELVPIGFFTSATGITVYRGGAYPEEFQGNVFIGDVGGNLVHRKKLTPDGISFVAERMDRDCEFLTSTDNWFRPANFVNAPDGTLYMLDMYRETIEHPASIPEDIKALCDLESGHDRGRIWRLRSPEMVRLAPPDLSQATTVELVEHLLSPHGAIRDTAQRLIVERQNKSAVELLRAITVSSLPWLPQRKQGVSSVARLHAAWALHGLKALNPTDVMGLLKDPNPRVQQHGIILLESVNNSECLKEIAAVLTEGSPRLRWQWAFTLGQLEPRRAVSGLKELAPAAALDPDLRTAWLSSVHPHMGTLAVELLAGDSEPVRPLLVELARLIGSSPTSASSVQLLVAVTKPNVPAATRAPVLTSLGEGLRRRGTSIAKVLDEARATDVVRSLNSVYEQAGAIAKDPAAKEPDRLAAISLLALAEAPLVEQTLSELFTPQTSPALQQAAIRSVIASSSPRSVELIMTPWKAFGPATRREVVDQLMTSTKGATALVGAVKAGTIKIGEIERDKRQLLLNHPNLAVRDAAMKVLADPPSNRKEVVSDYQAALDLEGNAERGQMLYGKTCVQCHRAGTAGHQVGPDLVSVQNKSPADLLVAILDPNREAQPSFQTYTAVTTQGTIHTGLISAETAATLTLRRAEAKEDVVLRDALEELISTGKSLMPEGLEKDVDKQALADLIAFIKAQTPPKK
ncbi:MAG: c-type cytochrome [Planctomycetes bacterium]|nr:c-type cytochrome [Planctomycetota bacterium]